MITVGTVVCMANKTIKTVNEENKKTSANCIFAMICGDLSSMSNRDPEKSQIGITEGATRGEGFGQELFLW